MGLGSRSIAADRDLQPGRLRRADSGIEIPDLPFIAAVSIVSGDLARTRSYMDANDIPLVVVRPGVSSMRLQGWGRISSFMQRRWAVSATVRDVWVFGYGSLIWRPDFPFVERRTAMIWAGPVVSGGQPTIAVFPSTGKGRYPMGSGCCLLGRSLSRRGRQT